MRLLLVLIVFISVELLLASWIFEILRSLFGSEIATAGSSRARSRAWPIWKGIVERSVVFFGLLSGFPHVLTVFGALKIGTRLKVDDKVSNDYFLLGNLCSIGLALFEVAAVRHGLDPMLAATAWLP